MRIMITYLVCFTCTVFLAGMNTACSHTNSKSHQDAEELLESELKITDSLSASRYSNIYFSGQPSASDFDSLAKQGFKTVINLRNPSEHDEDAEKRQLNELSINYYNLAFSGSDELNDAFITSVSQLVKKHRNEGKVLIHCSSGNRVGIWLAGHFHKDHGLSQQESLEQAKKLGLTKPGAILKAKRYLDQQNQ